MKSVYRDNKVVLITGGFMRKIARSSFRTESKRRLALRRLPVLIFFGSLGFAVVVAPAVALLGGQCNCRQNWRCVTPIPNEPNLPNV